MESGTYNSLFSKNVAENASNGMSLTRLKRTRRRLKENLENLSKMLGEDPSEERGKQHIRKSLRILRRIRSFEHCIEAYRDKKVFVHDFQPPLDSHYLQKKMRKLKLEIRVWVLF